MPHTTLPDQAPSDQILAELQASAELGDLSRLKAALAHWDDGQLAGIAVPFSPTAAERILAASHQTPAGNLALQRVLNTAAKTGHASVVAHLLEERGCAVTAPAIRWASSRKHWGVMQAFLDAGWDINTPIEGGNTCPVLKEILPSEEHVRWCLEHGADPSFRSAGGNNDIPSFGGKFGTVKTIGLLRDYGADFARSNALHLAAGSTSKGRIEVMTYLLDDLKVPINQREYEYDQKLYDEWKTTTGGGTALHSAVKAKLLENVEFLVTRGIDQRLKDAMGREAVDLARESGFDEAVALFEA